MFKRTAFGAVVVAVGVCVTGWFVPVGAFGECYTVTVYTGDPNPPSVTVCPWD